MTVTTSVACLCGGTALDRVFSYDTPPPGEVTYPFTNGAYRREMRRCPACGHYVGVAHMDLSALYAGTYVDSTYGDAEGVRRTFERIVSLPPERSDNAGRVRAILDFVGSRATRLPGRRPTVLDVGSGLCVFLHAMKRAGWTCTALDPDPRAARHARDVVGIDAMTGDFMTVDDLGRFDLVTFNKVLEHVADPVRMLARAASCLTDGGLVYVEVPDGEAAVAEGPGREEFFVEHLHVFSVASTAILAARAGFAVIRLERLREPSTKFTIRAFLVPGLAVSA